MTNAELLAKIKAEIERLIDERYNWEEDKSSESVAACEALTRVLSFLSTLEPEKPMEQEKFSKEFDDYFLPRNSEQKGRWGFADIFSLARHFYDLGCRRTAEKYDEIEYNRQRAEESVCDELDEEIAGMYQSLFGTDVINRKEMLYLDTFEAIARHFAQWGAEHAPLPEDTVLFNKGVAAGKRLMIEEAVEGEVMLNPYPTVCLDDCKDYDFKDGDEIRIIIV